MGKTRWLFIILAFAIASTTSANAGGSSSLGFAQQLPGLHAQSTKDKIIGQKQGVLQKIAREALQKIAREAEKIAAVRLVTVAAPYAWLAFTGYPDLDANSDEAHQRSAYLAGWETKDPALMAVARTAVEAIQFVGYTATNVQLDKVGLKDIAIEKGYSYETLSLDYLDDSVKDVKNSVKGAEDGLSGDYAPPY